MIEVRHYSRHLSNADDKRCKLTEEDIVELKEMYYSGDYLMKELAEIFGVHVDTIRFALHPKIRRKKNNQSTECYHRRKGELNDERV